jgi:2-polyprenyl-6-hydroxyphenyl methylase / 3-demethylubiquinone-9 3-methyltransferase
MAVDNDVYDREGAGWWDETNPLNALHGSITPGRFAYFQDAVANHAGSQDAGRRALDIGCGGGFLAEEFAKLGFDVVGVDPSEVSIETASRHARASGLDIAYRVGSGELLPVGDGEFDVVYCCDVLEHVSDLDAVLAETTRALRRGGIYLFDTINRTLQSKILAIKVVQEWSWTRMIDADIHDWDLFITPDELTARLRSAGLHVREVVGLGPRASKPSILLNFIRAKRGKITYGELSRRLDVGKVRHLGVSYMGHAVRREGSAT